MNTPYYCMTEEQEYRLEKVRLALKGLESLYGEARPSARPKADECAALIGLVADALPDGFEYNAMSDQ